MNINNFRENLADWASSKNGAELAKKIYGEHQIRDYKVVKKVCSVVKSSLQQHRQELGLDAAADLSRLKKLIQSTSAKVSYQTHSGIIRDLKEATKQIDDTLKSLEAKKQKAWDKAATVMQKHVRGHLVRKPLLPAKELSQYRAASAQANQDPNSMPRARDGKTPVRFPPNLPILLKQSGGKFNPEIAKVSDLKVLHPRKAYKDAYKRFDHMQVIRKILNSQEASHLIIPEAWVIDNHIVESKLPILGTYAENMDFYVSKPHLFNSAITELVQLASRLQISDWVEVRPQRVEIIRYDNLPFIDKGNDQCQIGLIDLEHFEEGFNQDSLIQLAIAFPYHLELIKATVLDLNLPVDNEQLLLVLELGSAMGMEFFNKEWVNYVSWLNNKGIQADSINPPLQISAQAKEQLISLIQDELEPLAKKQNINTTLKELATHVVKTILIDLKSVIEEKQLKKFGELSQDPMTLPNLIEVRSVDRLDNFSLRKGIVEVLKNAGWNHAPAVMDTIPLLKSVGQNLMKLGEIYDFQYGSFLSSIRY